MTKEELQQIRSALTDLRFIQAATLVAAQLQDSKEASKYMQGLARLVKRVDEEIAK